MVVDVAINPYSSMNLSEACYHATLEINDLINDLRIQTVLDEYAYLAEEGTALLYVPPKDIPNPKQDSAIKKIMDRIVAALKAFREKVFNLLDKAIISFQDKINAAKIMLLYLKYKKNYDIFKKLHPNDIEDFFRDHTSVAINPGGGKDIYHIFESEEFYMAEPMEIKKDVNIHTSDEVYNHYVKSKDNWSANGASDLYEDGIKKGFDTKWSMSFIKEYKNEVDKYLKNNIKEAESAINPTELLNKYSLMMKNNINVVHGYIRVWSKYIGECIGIIKAMASDVEEKTV